MLTSDGGRWGAPVGHKYLPWALGVQENLGGLASHHPPEERTVEATALRTGCTGWALRSVCHPVCPPQNTCPFLALALGSFSVYSSPSVPCSQQPRASSEHTSAGVCRNEQAGEGEGICSSVNNYLVSTLCGPGRRGAYSVGQRRPRARKYPDKYTAPCPEVKVLR